MNPFKSEKKHLKRIIKSKRKLQRIEQNLSFEKKIQIMISLQKRAYESKNWDSKPWCSN